MKLIKQIAARTQFACILCAAASLFCAAAASRADGILVQSGQRVAFLGASVTERGWNLPAGYVRLVVDGLAANGVSITPILAGVSGNTTGQMLARFQKDVLDKKPDWLIFCVGTNDENRRNPIPLAHPEANINSIIDQSQRAGIKVMLMTTNTVGENLDNAHDLALTQYDQFLNQVAAQKGFPIAEVKRGLSDAIGQRKQKSNVVTVDGVHPNLLGNEIMADTILRACGLDDSQMKMAQASWQDIPDGWSVQGRYFDKNDPKQADNGRRKSLSARVLLTVHQFDAFERYEESKNTTVANYANQLYAQDVDAYFKSPGSLPSVQAIYDANQQDAVQKHLQEEFAKQVQDELKAAGLK